MRKAEVRWLRCEVLSELRTGSSTYTNKPYRFKTLRRVALVTYLDVWSFFLLDDLCAQVRVAILGVVELVKTILIIDLTGLRKLVDIYRILMF